MLCIIKQFIRNQIRVEEFFWFITFKRQSNAKFFRLDSLELLSWKVMKLLSQKNHFQIAFLSNCLTDMTGRFNDLNAWLQGKPYIFYQLSPNTTQNIFDNFGCFIKTLHNGYIQHASITMFILNFLTLHFENRFKNLDQIRPFSEIFYNPLKFKIEQRSLRKSAA